MSGEVDRDRHAARHHQRVGAIGRLRRAAAAKSVMRAAPWAVAALLFAVSAVLGWSALTAPPRPLPAPQQSAAPSLQPAGATPPIGAGALVQPTGVAVAGDRVYVADPGLHAVAVFTRGGSRVATIGAGVLVAPVHVAVSPLDGRVYVVDRARGVIDVFAADSRLLRVAGPRGTGRPPRGIPAAWKPLSLGFAADGSWYVADVAAPQSIVAFSPTGSRTATIGADVPVGRAGARLAFPNGIAVTDSLLVVADSNNGRLLYLDRDGTLLRAVQLDGLPRGVAALPDGTFAVSDAATHMVRVFSAGGAEVAQVGGYGSDRGGFAYPAEVAADDSGRVYVADTGNGRIDILKVAVPAPSVSASVAARGLPLAVAAVVAALAGAALIGWAIGRRRRSHRAPFAK